MIGGFDIPTWSILVMSLVWITPVIIAGLVFYFGRRLGRYRIPASVVVLVVSFLLAEELLEALF